MTSHAHVCRRRPPNRIRFTRLDDRSIKALMRCRQWDCPDCGKLLKALFVAKARILAKQYNLHRFLTLTLRPEDRSLTVREQKARLMDAWRKLRKRIEHVRKRHRCTCRTCRGGCVAQTDSGAPATGDFQSLWVVEAHADGTLHMHVLVDRYLCQQWISKNWAAVQGGPVVDIRKVAIQRVVAYITKYLAKALGKDGISYDEMKGLRRYGTTRIPEGLALHPRTGNGEWGVEARLRVSTNKPARLEPGPNGLAYQAPAEVTWCLLPNHLVGTIIAHIDSTHAEDRPRPPSLALAERRHDHRLQQVARHVAGSIVTRIGGRMQAGRASQGVLA